MKNILLYIILAILGSSCSNAEKENEQKLFTKVMGVHDEVMPKMSDIHNLKKQLTESIVQVKDDSVQIANINRLVIELEEANESMMQWMRDFEKPDESMSHQEIMDYLKDQQIKIDEVKNKMEGSIKNASDALKN